LAEGEDVMKVSEGVATRVAKGFGWATLAVLTAAITGGCGGASSDPPPDPPSPTLYVTDHSRPFFQSIAEFRINLNSGLLSDRPGSNVAPAAGGRPQGIAITPTATFAYVADPDNGAISEYAIASSGALTLLPGSPVFPNGDCTDELVVNPSGKFLYVTDNCNGNVEEYRITSTGDLIPLPPSPLSTGGSETDQLVEDPTGSFVYAVDTSDAEVFEMAVDKTGSSCGAPGCLSLIGHTSTDGTAGLSSPTLSSPTGIAVDRAGKFVYVGDSRNSDVAEFAIVIPGTPGTACADGGANTAPGCLNSIGGTSDNVSRPAGLGVDPTGRFLYVANRRRTEGIAEFSIVRSGAGTAACGSGSSSTTPGCLNSIGFAPVPNFASGGALECPERLATLRSATPSKTEFLYASDDCENTVLEYIIDLKGTTACGKPGCLDVGAGGGAIPAGDSPLGIAVIN
jgi:DNA-binding beta-propeller fold protein YncE